MQYRRQYELLLRKTRLTVKKMKVMILTPDEQIITLNVDPNGTVEDLKAVLEVETGVPIQQQQMLYDEKEMIMITEKLRTFGVNDGDLVVMKTVLSRALNNDQLGYNPDGSAMNPSVTRQHILSDYDMMARIYMNDPELADTLHGHDLEWLQLLLRTRHSQRAELRRHQDDELALLHADQSDPEVRRKIKAAIPHGGVIEEWDEVLEKISYCVPKQFPVQKIRPYNCIDAVVNGTPLKVLVDTGADLSVMSKCCAEDCGLSKLIDTSYDVPVQGIGFAEIVGRINIAPIKIGNICCLDSFIVIESVVVPCLFGMAMLCKNQCIVDTKASVLRIRGGVDVPLLPPEDPKVSSTQYLAGIMKLTKKI